MFDQWFEWIHVTANGSATYSYFRAPYRCTIGDFRMVVQTDPGDSDTGTLIAKTGSETLGVATFGATLSGGDTVAWVRDTTNGFHVVDEGEILQVTFSSAAAAAYVLMQLKLNPYAQTTDDFNDIS